MLAFRLLQLARLGIVAAFAGVLLAVFVLTVMIVKPHAPPRTATPDGGLAQVRVLRGMSVDGRFVQGRLFAAGERRPSTLICGPYNASMDALTPLAQKLNAHGFSVVVFDYRAHGFSDGDVTSFGVHEAKDAIRMLDAAWEDRATSPEFAVWGIGMGVRVALQVGRMSPDIKALILQGPVASPRDTMAALLQERAGAWSLALLRPVHWLSAIWLDLPFMEEKLEDMQQIVNPLPVLVMGSPAPGGPEEAILRHATGFRAFAAIPGAGGADAVLTSKEGMPAVLDFLRFNLVGSHTGR